MRRRRWWWSGKPPLHLFIVIFISFILVFPPFFFLCLFARITFSHIPPQAASCAVCLSPLTLLLPPSYCLPRSSMFEVTRPGLYVPPLSPPSELCLLAISYFPSASSLSSSSSATRMAGFHDSLSVTWPSSRSFQTSRPPPPSVIYRTTMSVKLLQINSCNSPRNINLF